jgi:hypothetical protein
MITLIGPRCTRSNPLSRRILIRRSLRGSMKTIDSCSIFSIRNNAELCGTYAEGTRKLNSLFWWLVSGVIPVLIPNTEVKPTRADGTRKGRVGSRQNNEFKMMVPAGEETQTALCFFRSREAGLADTVGRPKVGRVRILQSQNSFARRSLENNRASSLFSSLTRS